MRAIQRILIVTFFASACAPALQLWLSILPPVGLAGLRQQIHRPELSRASFGAGAFQTGFDAWFGQNLGLRGRLVRTHNQLDLSLFGDISADTENPIVLGADDSLFERHYIDDLNRANLVSHEALGAFVERLEGLQDGLAARDVAFLLVITPSKASFQPERVPARYAIPDRFVLRSNYQRLLPILSRSRVNFLDAPAYLRARRTATGNPVFTRSGTHWTQPYAVEVAELVIDEIEAIEGRPMRHLRIASIERVEEPRGSDRDLSNLINVWNPGRFHRGEYRYPTVTALGEDAGFQPRVFVVGGSFTLQLLAYLDPPNVFGSRDLLFYYNQRAIHPSGDLLPFDPSTLDWDREVFDNDVVVLEANEETIDNAGFGFVDDALRHLR